MTDTIDQAQDREQLDRDLALQAHADRVAASFVPRADGIDGLCIDCDRPIEPERLRVLARKTSRCAHCAQALEHRQQGYRR
jgi:RNA polymerase-binding transcription factor DksA